MFDDGYLGGIQKDWNAMTSKLTVMVKTMTLVHL